MTERVDAAQILALLYDRPQGRGGISGLRRQLRWPSQRFHRAFGVLLHAELIDVVDNAVAIRADRPIVSLSQLIMELIDHPTHQEHSPMLSNEAAAAAAQDFAAHLSKHVGQDISLPDAVSAVAGRLAEELTGKPAAPKTTATAGLAQQIRDAVTAGQKAATRTPPSARPSRSGK